MHMPKFGGTRLSSPSLDFRGSSPVRSCLQDSTTKVDGGATSVIPRCIAIGAGDDPASGLQNCPKELACAYRKRADISDNAPREIEANLAPRQRPEPHFTIRLHRARDSA